MKFTDLPIQDWDAFQTTEDWVKLLNELRAMLPIANSAQERETLADTLDAYADHSSSDDLALISKLDNSARASAQALRISSMEQRVAALNAASSVFTSAIKEFSAASASLKKEAAKLRFDKTNSAITSLTGAVTSLRDLAKQLSAPGTPEADAQLLAAINAFVGRAQELRNILERPTPPSQ